MNSIFQLNQNSVLFKTDACDIRTLIQMQKANQDFDFWLAYLFLLNLLNYIIISSIIKSNNMDKTLNANENIWG